MITNEIYTVGQVRQLEVNKGKIRSSLEKRRKSIRTKRVIFRADEE